MNTKERKHQYYLKHREHIITHNKMWRQKHRAQYLAIYRNRRARMKLEVLTHYSNSDQPFCSWCGIADIDVLCIDHLNGGGGAHRRVIGDNIHGWLIKNHYPIGFQVLCANCNMKKGAGNHKPSGIRQGNKDGKQLPISPACPLMRSCVVNI